jgi:hypothetical protein
MCHVLYCIQLDPIAIYFLNRHRIQLIVYVIYVFHCIVLCSIVFCLFELFWIADQNISVPSTASCTDLKDLTVLYRPVALRDVPFKMIQYCLRCTYIHSMHASPHSPDPQHQAQPHWAAGTRHTATNKGGQKKGTHQSRGSARPSSGGPPPRSPSHRLAVR